jgi:hypothetical protein
MQSDGIFRFRDELSTKESRHSRSKRCRWLFAVSHFIGAVMQQWRARNLPPRRLQQGQHIENYGAQIHPIASSRSDANNIITHFLVPEPQK